MKKSQGRYGKGAGILVSFTFNIPGTSLVKEIRLDRNFEFTNYYVQDSTHTRYDFKKSLITQSRPKQPPIIQTPEHFDFICDIDDNYYELSESLFFD